jgi:hypothetical protein
VKAGGRSGVKKAMQVEPTIRPLSTEGNIYALCDETGKTIGTGTLEVCEVLMYIITKASEAQLQQTQARPVVVRSNIRAAIAI